MNKINLFAKYGSDLNKEVKGVPFYIDKDADCYILVGRWCSRNVEHNKAQAELSKKLVGVPELEAEQARKRVFVEHLVKGWNNVYDKDGNELPFTTENAATLLVAELPDLSDDLFTFSMNRENFGLDSVEKAVKNS